MPLAVSRFIKSRIRQAVRGLPPESRRAMAAILTDDADQIGRGGTYVGARHPVEFPVEGWHETPSARLPVHGGYRWATKRGWNVIPSLNGLAFLSQAGRLDGPEKVFFDGCIGTRSVLRGEAEIDAFAAPIFARNAEFFIPGSLARLPRLLADHAPMRIRLAAAHHAQGFRWAREAGLPVPAEGSRALEIGFNEGYSPLALATLGFDVTAIDNSYGLDDRAPGEIGFFSSVVGASVSALYADLTRGLPFPDGHFDYVFSSSVLEHILDIKGALAELRRVLRPGGLAVHSFGSYHCCDGAHAIAIPDQPWGHSRMTADQYVSYIKTWRPYESDRAAAWLESAIARRPIAATAAALAQTGFDIHRWIETPSPKSHLAHLAPDVVREALNANPDISIADLTTRDVYFIAT